jgi:REP element-mobilizing transposase RayT
MKEPMDGSGFSPPRALLNAWEGDGLRVRAITLGMGDEQRGAQMVCESASGLAPVFVAQRLKGRLNHALRRERSAFGGFERLFYLGTLGQNDREVVRRYIQNQVDRSDLVDPLYRERMKALRFHREPGAAPRGKHKGIHDHALHVVLVTAGRYRMRSPEARRVARGVLEGAEAKGVELLEFSIMPDHAHLLVRPDHHRSPEQTLEEIKRGSGEVLRRTRFWQNGGYTGTVGPYPLEVALRRSVEKGGWVRE